MICPIMSKPHEANGEYLCHHDECEAWQPPTRCKFYSVCNEAEDKFKYNKFRLRCQELYGDGKCINSGYCKLIGEKK
jgi:hypothetical protein